MIKPLHYYTVRLFVTIFCCISFFESPSQSLSIKHPTSCISVCDVDPAYCTTVCVSVAYEVPSGVVPAQYVAVMPQGAVVNDGTIITADGHLVRDFENYDDEWPHHLYSAWEKIIFGKNLNECDPQFFDGRLAVLSSAGTGNYYHWLLQIIPRLSTLAQSHIPYDKIYINNIRFAWQKESLCSVLQFLEIPEEKLMIVEENSAVIQARELIVPSITYIPSKWQQFPLWVRTFLRDVFLGKDLGRDKSVYSEKIFISRARASYRRIANESSLRNYLESVGFKTIMLEELSVQEQARCFDSANVIVGPHGAGFANLVFARPGTLVVEIDHRGCDEPRSHFKRLSKILECEYHPFYSECKTDDHMEDDIIVDLEDFKKHLEHVLREK